MAANQGNSVMATNQGNSVMATNQGNSVMAANQADSHSSARLSFDGWFSHTLQASILRFPLPAKVLQEESVDQEAQSSGVPGAAQAAAEGKNNQSESLSQPAIPDRPFPKAAASTTRAPNMKVIIGRGNTLGPATISKSSSTSYGSAATATADAGVASGPQPSRSAAGKKPAERVGLFNTKLSLPKLQAQKNALSSASSESTTYYGY
jgi:hypothetical protein